MIVKYKATKQLIKLKLTKIINLKSTTKEKRHYFCKCKRKLSASM